MIKNLALLLSKAGLGQAKIFVQVDPDLIEMTMTRTSGAVGTLCVISCVSCIDDDVVISQFLSFSILVAIIVVTFLLYISGYLLAVEMRVVGISSCLRLHSTAKSVMSSP